MQLSAGMFLQLPEMGIRGDGNENYFRSIDNSKNSNQRSVCAASRYSTGRFLLPGASPDFLNYQALGT